MGKCVLCGKSKYPQNDRWLCADCQSNLPRIKAPLPEKHIYLNGIAATFAYQEPIRHAIQRMKFEGKTILLDYFGLELAQTCTEVQMLWHVDCITYVPVSLTRWWVRGYNQSAELAKIVAKRTGLPCKATLWRRPFSAKQSAQKDATARQKHAARNFFPRKQMHVTGKVVLLVDDICTTGASAEVCAKLLKEAGATKVYLLCVGRA